MVKNALAETKKNDFPDSVWNKIVENTALSSNLDEKEKWKIRNNPVAKLIAALPYYAGCKNPDQLAVLKVGIYLAAERNPGLFSHRSNQSTRERIQPLTICPAGNSKVINLVTTFLELISINDHLSDYDKDSCSGHPNPLNANPLYYYARQEQLIQEIENYPDQDLVQHLTRIADPIILDFWTMTDCGIDLTLFLE